MDMTEYTIQRLYFQQKYSDALSMCNSVMGAVAAADAPGNRTGSHSRELLDMAMRCALKLQDHRNAGELADQSKEYVSGNRLAQDRAHCLQPMTHFRYSGTRCRDVPQQLGKPMYWADVQEVRKTPTLAFRWE